MNEKEEQKENNIIKKGNITEKKNDNISEEKYLLPPKASDKIYKKTLILDLDETLAHGQNIPFSSSKNQKTFQCILNNINTTIYFKTRPGVKDFLRKMNKLYEIVIFTASIEEYAKPLINLIDTKNFCSHKLYREQCTYEKNVYIKDLKKLGRDLKDVVIVDNSPSAYSLNKENGIPISTWFDDDNDRELYNIVQILEFLSEVDDVRVFIPKFVIGDEISYFASVDIIRKYKSNFLKNNNMSAINFHPYIDDSDVNNNQLTDINSHSILVEKAINEEVNEKEIEQNNKFKDEIDKKEKELIDISENLFDDIILNENINKTDLDINIKEEMNLLNNGENDKNDENSDKIKNEKNDNKINNDIKDKTKNEIFNNKEKEKKENNKENKGKNINEKIENKKENSTLKKAESKTSKNHNKNKTKTISKNNNIRKIRHNKSSSCSINTISNFNLLTTNNKSKREFLNKDKNKLVITNLKSKTVKRPKKKSIEENTKKKFYHPRNIITDFKPLKTLNTSVNKNPNNKNQSKIKTISNISNTPKKMKKSVKNKMKNRILLEISKSKEKKEKEKTKEDSKVSETNKKENINKTEISKKELIKHRKKTPFRVHPKKNKNNNSKVNNLTLQSKIENEKENKINYRNKISNLSLEKNTKDNNSLLNEKTTEQKYSKTIINLRKAAKSTKTFYVNKKIENRLPWGWGGYTIKLSDLDNFFNYNVESREIRIAKLDLNIFKRAKSCKPLKKEKIKKNEALKNKDSKSKRGISSSNSASNMTFNKIDYKKEENI